MATTSDYLNQLETDRQNFGNKLTAKGVTVTGNETFTELIPKMDEIQGGGSGGSLFDGSYDRVGLKSIGWTDEDVDYYNKYGVTWNKEYNYLFKLNTRELVATVYSSANRFIPKNTQITNYNGSQGKFDGNKVLIAIPLLNTSNVTNMQRCFYGCSSLRSIPLLNTSNVTSMYSCFNGCSSLRSIPLLNTSNVTSMYSCFNGCSLLQAIPLLNTSNVTNMQSCFNGCSSLQAIPLLNTSNVTSMYSCFSSCYSLQVIPQLDTSKVTDMYSCFNCCYSLQAIPLLDTSKVTGIQNCFNGCWSLQHLDGFKDLGKAYLTVLGANYTPYKLELIYSNNLTHDSLMNVINNLYDIKTKGVPTQELYLGATNKAKLTATEIAIATNKGWSVS